MSSSSLSPRPTNPSTSIITVLSADLLLLLLDRLPSPHDRKSWRLVCKEFLRAEHLQRKSLKVLRGATLVGLLRKYRAVEAIDLSLCPCVDDRMLFSAFGRSTCLLRSVDLSRSSAVRWWGLEVLVGGCPRLEKVALSYCCCVGDLEMAALARAGGLRELDVAKCLGVTDVGLARVAVGCSGLERLGLKWCLEITDIGIDLLTKKCRGLKALDISYLKVTNGSLCSISSLESLEVLCMVGCFFVDDDGLDYLNNGVDSLKSVDVSRCGNISSLGITSLLRGHGSIEKLVAGYCGSVIAPSLLLRLKESEKCLKTIELDGFYVSITILRTIGLYCKALMGIGLSKCSGVTDECIFQLVSQCSGLRKIDLTCCHLITDNTLAAIGKFCKKLVCLKLESCTLITAKGLNEIGTHCSHLQEIDLTDCCINDKALEYLSQCSELVELKLGLCSSITDKGLSYIGSNCRRLQILDLYRCTGIGDDGLASISSGCKNLKKLNVCYCTEISDQGLKHLSVLQELSDLEMRKVNAITNVGITAIAIGCKSLVEIDLKQCHGIGDMALWALARYTENLRQINVSSCLVTDIGLLVLVGKLRCLQNIKLVNLPCVSVEGFEYVLRVARDRLKKVKLESGLKCLLSPMIIHALENRGCRIRYKPSWNVDK